MVVLYGHLCWLCGQEWVRVCVCVCVYTLYACVSIRSSPFQLVGGRAEQDQLASCTGHHGAL